ncbi:hypothetical protein CONCODRAFT_13942 [Conidiobolus coronatus NRRL 28638]|uniref:G-protein coupled receptors family 1 profile domain-containing protein n=1 Tax=Conidiobolus coronatus (strain ATCC 28846 / CBS 209.66 / NRRL 28638) TaxID=796925 RepID=A0A137NPW0_CONC2|nr:hypothetical protein CONCODRAFT_13942 [Conidiobolus coronatus NRRL 28638]|eukprot:KXN64779.1 hypothetical protein CONCODRAFT_13942 [Conidiobolus coronatus NRRL 28638]
MAETSEETYLNALKILFTVISIFNLFFTLIILGLLFKYISKKAHNDTVLTTVAVIIDLLASLGLLFRGVISNYSDNILKLHYNWCAFDVSINSVFLTYSGYALSMLSLERMLLIVFKVSFPLYFWLFWIILLYSLLFTQAIYQSIIGNATVSPIQFSQY